MNEIAILFFTKAVLKESRYRLGNSWLVKVRVTLKNV